MMLAEYHHCQHLISKQLDVDPFQKKEKKRMADFRQKLLIMK